ncbi:uncharacterized protein LOC143431597 isoform X2 [Xylocopa sonorina]|uniref:uncharacterized protein LOC143431597 isoform X2 n=1 Tax=Xylocopa sonorina TaxID=1818115 RepID=UPI00403AAE99
MDSPPSCSLSATGPLSDLGSSGIGGSISSDSVRAHLAIEMQESDIESKSLSQDSFDYSDGMCGENFNTLKKGPGWNDTDGKLEVEVVDVAIKPPPEFQDSPSPPNSESSSAPILSYARLMKQKVSRLIDDYAENLVQSTIEEALIISCRISWPEGRIAPATNHVPVVTRSVYNPKRLWATDLLTPSSCQGATTLITPYNTLNRPNSRCSLASSRLSSSHNSINTSGLSHKVDDSSFITSAMSHDVLTTSEISDMYNVPFDSDIYTVPIDVVRPLHDLRTPQRPKRHRHHRKRRRNVSASSQSELEAHIQQARHYCGKPRAITHVIKSQRLLSDMCCNETGNGKRHSVPGTSGRHTSRTSNGHMHNIGEPIHMTLHEVRQYLQTLYSSSSDSSENKIKRDNKAPRALPPLPKSNGHVGGVEQAEDALTTMVSKCESPTSIPPQMPAPPPKVDDEPVEDTSMDFAASIEKVKDYGWYWGPISGEAAEKILSNEPDGSFIVRDSSDDHYIFSLSFRLNSCVRHVRIEHDQGNFSFGSCTKFKSHTIVDFIENAVEHSRSGRYLFFLHRRPVLGPMRVQLLHPVSRFKQVQSLQHTCRFVILKMVRRDLIPTLPLPRRLIDYLSTPHYYSEQLAEQDDRAESPVSSSTGELEKICFTPQGLS